MSLLQSLAAAFKGGAPSRVPLARGFVSPWLFGEGMAKGPFDYARAVRRAYLDNPVAQRAVRLVAEGIGGAPLRASEFAFPAKASLRQVLAILRNGRRRELSCRTADRDRFLKQPSLH